MKSIIPLPPQPRVLALVDMATVLEDDSTCDLHVDALWSAFTAAVDLGPNDQIVVGSTPRSAPAIWFGLTQKNTRHVVGRGPGGSHRALLDAVDIDHAATRYDELVIASGNGGFTPLAIAAAARGMRVHIVTGRWTSHPLIMAGHQHTRLRGAIAVAHVLAAA